MLIGREKVATHLLDFLMPEDKKHFDLITDLSWAATIVFEFGFQCPKNKQEESKKKLLDLVQRLGEARTKVKVPVKMEEYNYKFVFPNEGRKPTNEDIAIACDLFHKLAVQEKKISKEKMLEWLQEAWDFGTQQQLVYSMEIEGGIMNEYGVVTSFGADLAMFGSSKGFLPE